MPYSLCNNKQIIRYKYDTESLYYKQQNLKFGTSLIIFYYDIFSPKIKLQNVIKSDLKKFFIMSKYDDYLKY